MSLLPQSPSWEEVCLIQDQWQELQGNRKQVHYIKIASVVFVDQLLYWQPENKNVLLQTTMSVSALLRLC